MTRFELVPTPTGDRRLILKVVPVPPRERLRRLIGRLTGRR
jgi:hypothetical protein